MDLQGIRFRVRRTGNGQNGDGRRGVRGSGGSEGRKEDEARWRRCSAREISWGRMWSRRDSCVQTLFARMMPQSAVPSIFLAAVLFWGGALRGLSRNRGRGCEGRPETVGCRLEGLLASQGAKESVQNLGGFGSDWKEFRVPCGAEEPEPVREADLVFDLAG